MNAIFFLSFLLYTTTADVPSENTIGCPHGACDTMSTVNIFVVFISFSV